LSKRRNDMTAATLVTPREEALHGVQYF